ncbi:MAG: hypothetical protein WCF94_03875 [bacterium]
MELKPEQLHKFKELHKNCAGFENYSDEQISEVANGVANYYLTLFNIQQRIRTEERMPRNNAK